MSLSKYRELVDPTGVRHYIDKKTGKIEFSVDTNGDTIYPDGTVKKSGQ